MSVQKPTPGQRRRILAAVANNGELVRVTGDRMFWIAVARMRDAGFVGAEDLRITDAARAAVNADAPAVAVVHAFNHDPERAAAATLCGDGPNVRGPREIVNCPACLALIEEQRRANAIEAVRASGDTTTTPRAMRLIGAITEHGNYGSAMNALHAEAAEENDQREPIGVGGTCLRMDGEHSWHGYARIGEGCTTINPVEAERLMLVNPDTYRQCLRPFMPGHEGHTDGITPACHLSPPCPRDDHGHLAAVDMTCFDEAESAVAANVRNVPIPARPAIGVEDAIGNPLHEGDAVEVLGDEGQMYAVSHADPEGRGLWVYPLGVSMGKERQVSAVEVRKQRFENVDGVVKYVPATPVEPDVDAEDGDGWGQPDGMLGATETERAAAEPVFEQDDLVSAETRAVIASLVEAIIDREYGRNSDGLDNDDVVRGAHMLARAAVKMDLHAHYVGRAGTEIGLDGFADSALGRLMNKGLKARECECVNGTKHRNTLHVHIGPCTGHAEADVPLLDGKRYCGSCHIEAYADLPADVLAIAKAADLFELACETGVDIDAHARTLHDLMRPYFSGLLAEAITLGISTGRITPETDHPVRIDGPSRTGGQHWAAACAACYAEGTGYEEAIEVVAAAVAHGPLAADTLRALDEVEPDEETLADLETITELAVLIVAGPRSAMVEQTLKDTLDAIGVGKPIG